MWDVYGCLLYYICSTKKDGTVYYVKKQEVTLTFEKLKYALHKMFANLTR